MFYLLENNEIIDSNNLRANLPFELAISLDIYIKDDKVILKDNYSGRLIDVTKIKKKSENILELIEVGDLIKIDSDLTKEQLTLGSGVYEVLSAKRLPSGEWKIKTNADGSDINGDWYEFFPETLIAIYKLDAKENYIKVWEDR